MTGFRNVWIFLRPVALFAIGALTGCSSRQASNEQPPSGREHNSTENFGFPSQTQPPSWVPVYPGSRVSGLTTRNVGGESYTEFNLETSADCEVVFAWYDEQLKLAGYSISKLVTRTSGCDGALGAEGPGRLRSIAMHNFAGHDGKDSSFAVVAVSREAANHAQVGEAAQIPDWVPRYPNSTPANILVRRLGQRREFDFSFVTDDDAQKVIGWYQQKFNAQQFTVVNSSVFESSGQITAQDAAGRSIITVGVVPAGKRNGVSIEARDGLD